MIAFLRLVKAIWSRHQDWEYSPLDRQMRRKVNGRWEYRPASPEEETEHVSADAW